MFTFFNCSGLHLPVFVIFLFVASIDTSVAIDEAGMMNKSLCPVTLYPVYHLAYLGLQNTELHQGEVTNTCTFIFNFSAI